jgi:hypothetical protein
MIRDVWSTSDDDVWFAGDQGTLMRFDGSRWKGEIGLTTREIARLAGTGPDDVWSNEWPLRLAHWDGVAWSDRTPPGGGRLGNIATRSKNDVWVVRASSDTSADLVHFDGTSWTTIKTAARFIGSVQSVGPGEAWFTDDTSVWRVRVGGSPELVDARRLQHLWYSGSVMWALSDEEVLRRDGDTWTAVATIKFPQALTGCGERIYVRGNPSPLYEWDGTKLATIAVPFEPNLIHCTKGGDLWLVSGSRIARRRGDAWWAPPGNRLFTDDMMMFASSMWGPAANDLYLAGGKALFHFDGSTWSLFSTFDAQVESVSGSAADDLWVSGPITGDTMSLTGAVLHREGNAWKRYDIPGARPIGRIAVISPRDVWAVDVGVPARAHHFNGTTWSSHDLGGTNTVREIVARGPDDVWFAASGGLVHYTGGTMTKVPLDDPYPAVTALYDGPSGLLVGHGHAGAYSRVLRMQGNTFTPFFVGVGGAQIDGLNEQPNGDVWLVGTGMHWLHKDQWTQTAAINLRTRLYSKREGDIWAHGSANGAILLRWLAPGLH